MKYAHKYTTGTLLAVIAAAALPSSGWSDATAHLNPWHGGHSRYIVQAANVADARHRVSAVGGNILRPLDAINAISADLDDAQVGKLRAAGGVKLFKDRAVGTQGNMTPTAVVLTDGTAVSAKAKDFQTNYPMLVGADVVQQSGITGANVTIAVLDTGLWMDGPDGFDSRVIASIDLISGGANPVSSDPYGHGMHDFA